MGEKGYGRTSPGTPILGIPTGGARWPSLPYRVSEWVSILSASELTCFTQT